MWDTAGSERFRALTNNYYHEASGAILVYSVEDTYTLENLQEYIHEAASYLNMNNFVWALLGNKLDLPCEVEKDIIDAQCNSLGTKLSYSVSAKTGENVTKAFDDLVVAIHKKQISRQRNPSIYVQDTPAVIDTVKSTPCRC